MKIHPLILPKKLLVAISGVGIAMLIGIFTSLAQGGEVNETWLYVGIILNSVSFIAVILDITRNPVKNKMMWALVLATLTMLAAFVYLIGRERFLEAENM